MSKPQWIETCRVCRRDVRNDEIDENGICDECMPVLADEIRRLRAENERLKAERDEARALLIRVNDHTGFSACSDPLPREVLHYVAAHCG